MKTILITGASTGLGRAAALLFQSKGWRVLATMRNMEKGKDLAALENIKVLELDVTDPQQINQVAAEVIADTGVDVILNNAGYGLAGPAESLTDEQIVEQLNTNLLGVIRVTNAFIPYFREKNEGLFVAVTSLAGLIPVPVNSIYNTAKTGVEAFYETLAFELDAFNIVTKTVSPGVIKSAFIDNVKIGMKEEYTSVFQRGMQAMAFDTYSSTSEEMAEIVYEAITDSKKQLNYVAGEDAQKHYEHYLKLGRQGYIDYLRAFNHEIQEK
ncbi:short-chain dehydrogenase/reductase [Chryseobacterium artocarpi]|uniref:Short-chain dehydrogenase/reductase n=1 Tax=Chryseobacterium artocarpi TaxID=1414727 RepID=A0A1B8ZZW3_9FLAO|nr:SDR family oxidoreductase [Chryseobacterium artocarpi]OCA77084.1 short-chain dehydrogenase/reductase [Chryseobacterium artocarpi]